MQNEADPEVYALELYEPFKFPFIFGHKFIAIPKFTN